MAIEVAGLVPASGPVTDLEIEAVALLSLVGRVDLPGFVERLLSAQNADGGFSPTSQNGEPSEWHPSGLALCALLSFQDPEAPLVPLIDPG